MPPWSTCPTGPTRRWTLSFLVRSSQPSDALIPEMRRAIWQIDPQVAIPTLKSMDDQVSDSVATDRFQAMVLSGFGAAALLLALLGVYGVLAYSVSLRRQEFGIRIALGSGKSAHDRAGAAPGCVSRSSGHGRSDWRWRLIALALGAQPALSNAGHGPAGNRRQRAAASGGRRDRSDCARPPRSFHRSDARTEVGVGVDDRLDAHSAHRLAARLCRNSTPMLIYA